MSNVFVGENCRVGRNVQISAGVVIGNDGFGYEKNEEGEFEKFPQIGSVVIEDEVEIGANTCIDRGTLGYTLIKKGVNIDKLVHIAHNVIIDKDTLVIANAMVGGSVRIGNGAWIAPSATILDGLKIGDNTIVGLASLVTKNIPNNEIWMGFPVKKLRENL